MQHKVQVPVLAESISEARLLNWYRQAGERVQRGDNLVDIETDKVTLELPAPVSGTLHAVLKEPGELVQSKEVIALIEDAVVESQATASPASAATPAPDPPPLETSPSPHRTAAPASGPAVRNLLKGHGLKAEELAASGQGGRLLKEDVLRHLSERIGTADQAPPPAPAVSSPPGPAPSPTSTAPSPPDSAPAPTPAISSPPDPAPSPTSTAPSPSDPALAPAPAASSSPGPAPAPAQVAPSLPDQTPGAPPGPDKAAATASPGEHAQRPVKRMPMSGLRRNIAQRLLQAQRESALLSTFNEVDMRPILQLRKRYRESFEKRHGTKLGLMSFFTRSVVEALQRFPVLNASIDGNDVVHHEYYDIGIAVSAPRGLVVPVLRNADRMSLADIEQQIRELSEKARTGKISVEELLGGTFTITNGGVFGSLLSTPIINPPQSAILGMHKIQERPIAEDGEVVVRPMMYLALSYDHRLIDGRDAVQFLVCIKELLEDPARMLIQA